MPQLEWFGMFEAHREILAGMYEQQELGLGLLIVADLNGFPIAQVCVDFTTGPRERVGRIWALRVFPFLRGAGLGSRMISAAEHALVHRGFEGVEIGTEKTSTSARRLFERLGYRQTRELCEPYSYTTPGGTTIHAVADQWMLEKSFELARDLLQGRRI